MKVHNDTDRAVFVEGADDKPGTTIPPGEDADVPDGDAVKGLIEAGVLSKGAARKTEEKNGGEDS